MFTWKEFENAQKHFLTKFLQVKKRKPYTLLFYEEGTVHIEEILCDWMQVMEKWFGSWDATYLLHNGSIDSFVNKAFL